MTHAKRKNFLTKIKPYTPSTTTTTTISTSTAPNGILVKLFPVSSGTKHRVVQTEPEQPIEEAKKPDAITTVAVRTTS